MRPDHQQTTIKKHFISFNQKLFLSVITLFLVFAGCFLIYQHQREKAYKIELLNIRLQDYNGRIRDNLAKDQAHLPQRIRNFIDQHHLKDLRITIIDRQGKVIFDNSGTDYNHFDNHLTRPEIQDAIRKGSGYAVRRLSESTGEDYFYSATCYSDYIIRSALPYTVSLVNTMKADRNYLWFTGLITLLLLVTFYRFTRKLGTSIMQLKEFAMRADRNEPIETSIRSAFPNNELGEISQHIIQIYQRLHRTKEALYIEREKLIKHLQISHEGLGVFNRNKQEILVNNLFIQYSNLISDQNLVTTEEVLGIKELEGINAFINQNIQSQAIGDKKMAVSIRKNGRSFEVECIIFQDGNFEISINDVTQEEEQIRLKRQLTQNIAHELKTPVSSIQGYLETIINTPDISVDKVRAFLERCYAQSNRLSRLLRDISVLTRMDEAANMIDMEKVDIGQMVTNIINEVALQTEEKKITVINKIRMDIQICGNYSLVYSIFRNLMDNAIAYAGCNIQILINCFREDDRFYYFSFADTGVGVPQEHLNRLFERFYRVDKGRSRKLGGTGLGLAIVKNAVILHGGSISAKSTPGSGLEFIFTLKKN